MKIAIAHSFYRVAGGEDRYVRDQVSLLATRHDVHLIERRNADLAPGAAVARMTYAPSESKRLEREFAAQDPGVVHLHNAYPGLGPAVHLAARKRGIPLVMTVHNLRLRCPNGLMFTQGELCRRCEGGAYLNAVTHGCFPTRGQAAAYAAALWLHRFALRLEHMPALFIAPSEHIRARLLEWGFDPGRIRLIRNFTRPPAAPSAPGDHGVFVGRLSHEKGVATLLRALAAAGDPPFRVVGDGPERATLLSLAATLGLTRTEFIGRVSPEEVWHELRRSRYLVVPSTCEENAPLAALEAMAAGRPLVVSALGGLPELVAEGRGVQTPPGDADGLAAGISRYAGDLEAAAKAGERTASFAASELSPAAHLQALEIAYTSVTRQPRPAR